MHLNSFRPGKMSLILLLHGIILCSQLKCFLLSWPHSLKRTKQNWKRSRDWKWLCKSKGLLPRPSQGLWFGQPRDNFDSLLFYTRQEPVASKCLGCSGFNPECGSAEATWASWLRLLKKQRWIQKGLWQTEEISTWWQSEKEGSRCHILLQLLLFSCFGQEWLSVLLVQVTRCWALKGLLLWIMFSKPWSLPGSKSKWCDLKLKCQHLSGMWHLFGLSCLV